MPETENVSANADRQAWLRILALSPVDRLAETWNQLGQKPETRFLRAPGVGLAMVRGRAGGAGNPFNLGEMSVTRCVVIGADSVSGQRLDGFGIVAGRDKEKAELVANLDLAFQDSAMSVDERSNLIEQLMDAHATANAEKAAKTAATKVEFFTMERGHRA